MKKRWVAILLVVSMLLPNVSMLVRAENVDNVNTLSSNVIMNNDSDAIDDNNITLSSNEINEDLSKDPDNSKEKVMVAEESSESQEDFVIENGVLKKYKGAGGNVVIPDGVTVIGEYAFELCRNMSSITIPNSVTRIAPYAFSQCHGLTNVIIPDSVTEIGESAFYWCSNLANITIPDSVTEIGSSAFAFCRSITSIKLPKGLLSISDSLFDNCDRLTSITFPDNLQSIGDRAICNCYYLESVVIPKSVKKLGVGAISDCLRLHHVVIPNTITNFEWGLFQNCNNLKEVYFGGTEAQWRAITGHKEFIPSIVHYNYVYPGDEINDDDIIMDEKVIEERVSYINQHRNSSLLKLWNIFHETLDTMNLYEDNIYTEASHSAVLGLNFFKNVITVNINGVVKQFSANAYNAILLDMYYDINMEDDEIMKLIYDDSLEDAIKKSMKPLLDTIKKSSSVGNNLLKFNELKYLDDAEKWFRGEYPEYTLWDLLEKNGIQFVENADKTKFIEEIKGIGITSEEMGEIGDVAKGIKTVGEFIDDIKAIICASTLRDMNETYRQILIQIRTKAESIEGHNWEKTDLINALDYEIYYRENYTKNITWESAKAAFEAVYSTKDVKDLEKKIWKDPLEKLIMDTFPDGGAILDKLSAIQLGVEVGWSISDSMFNLTNSTDLYYKGKAYGVLEKILMDVLNDTFGELSYCEYTAPISEINKKYEIAEKYDYVFRMYQFIEENGCLAYAQYEKSFLPDSDNCLNAFMHKAGNVVEIILRVSYGDLSVFDSIVKRELLRNYNVEFYKRRADFAKNLKCHGEEFKTDEGSRAYIQMIRDKRQELLDKDWALAAILCPVEVDVYDENSQLVGTISKTENTIEKNLNVLAYRNESMDANIIVYPADYSIKIRGTDDGTMNAFGSYYSNGDIQNAVGYYNVPISSDYVADFAIVDDEDHLIDNNSTLSNIKINDKSVANFDGSITQYNVDVDKSTTEIPKVTVSPSNPNAIVNIKQAISLTGSEAERTAQIIVTATDGVAQTVYTIIFAAESNTSEKPNTGDSGNSENGSSTGNNNISGSGSSIGDDSKSEKRPNTGNSNADGKKQNVQENTNINSMKNSEQNISSRQLKQTDEELNGDRTSGYMEQTPQTGDKINMIAWIALLMISIFGLLIILKRGLKNKTVS